MGFFEQIAVILQRYYPYFLDGVKNTLIIAAMSVVLGVVFGTLMAIMRMCRIKPLRWLAMAYIEFVRGTPLMVQLMFIFYGLPMVGIEFPDVSFIPNFSRFMAGIVAMSINSCAYVAEVIRSGIQSVDEGQMEAARSIGFKYGESMRLVILPQAIRNICDRHLRSDVWNEWRHRAYIQEPAMPCHSGHHVLYPDVHQQSTDRKARKEDEAWKSITS